MLEAVPLRVDLGVGEPVRAREIDDDASRRWIEQRRLLVGQAEEGDVRARLQAASFVMNRGMRLQPFRPSRGSSVPGASPASESEPSA
jgi:hypothetical protein